MKKIQLEKSKEICEVLNIPIYSLETFEADDMLGTIVEQMKDKGVDIIIASGDMDTMQLVESDKVKVYTNKEFDMSGIVMSYYRYPQKIELEDLSNPESNFKTNPELDDKFVNRVIDLTVSDFLLSQSDARYQALKVNAATKL